MKNLLKSLFAGALFTVISIPTFAFFEDVTTSHTHYDSIENLYTLGLIEDDENFRPDELITKAEFYKMLIEYSDMPLSTEINLPYSDTDNSAEYAPYLQTAIDLDVLKPFGSNPQFHPDQTITKFTALITLFKNLAVGTTPFYDHDEIVFTDVRGTSHVAPIANKASEVGIFESDNNSVFRMAKRITRAETAYYLNTINKYDPQLNSTSPRIVIQATSSTNYTKTEQELIDNKKFDVLLDIWSSLQTSYLHNDELNNDELISGAIKGMVEQAGDVYTTYQKPDEAEAFFDQLNGANFEGVGMILDMINDNITIVSPLKESPAEEAGLKPNDIIINVDGQDVTNFTLEGAVKLIRGPAGTTVKLTILRSGEQLTINVVRDFILMSSAESEVLNYNGKNIAHIEVFTFGTNTMPELRNIYNEIKDQDIDGIVFDLRNNPGGLLDVAVDMVSMFTDEQKTAVKFEYGTGSTSSMSTTGSGEFKDYETVLLINGGSASASEIVAGALQDLSLATVLGEQSYGKGTVQSLTSYSDGSLFKYTISKWLTPNGRDVNQIGITPNIKVTNQETSDTQLNRALQLF